MEAWLAPLTASRRWAVGAAVLSVCLGMLLAFPAYGNLGDYVDSDQWRYIIERTRGDFVSQAGELVDTRPINLTWRVAPRLLGWLLHIAHPWQYLVLQAVFGLILLWTLALLVEELLESRLLATLVTIGVGGTYSAASAWLDLRGNFDAIALAFVLLMMRTRRPAYAVAFGAAAVFTDERAFFVLPIVVLFHLYRDRDVREPAPWRDLAAPMTFEAGLLVVGSLVVRQFFTWRFGLFPLSNTRPGNHPFFDNLNQYPVGTWTALEGGWLLVGAAAVAMWHRRQWMPLLVGGTVLCGTLFLGLSVTDITRSVAFLLPAVVLAILWIRDLDPVWLRRCVWSAVTLSMVWPVMYVAGPRTVEWFYPAPLYVARSLGLG